MSSFDSIDIENSSLCRICLEEDTIDNLINPCKCSGTSKYVHKQCLNEWRMMSINSDNYKRCELCHYFYKTKENCQDYTKIIKFCRFTTKYPTIFYVMYCFIILLGGFLLKTIDIKCNLSINSNKINKDMVYFAISGFVVIFIQISFIVSWILNVKNKKLYFSQYLHHKNNLFWMFIWSIVIGYIFSWFCLIFTLQSLILRIILYHFSAIEILDKLNNDEIINYDETVDNDNIVSNGKVYQINEEEISPMIRNLEEENKNNS